MMADSPEICKTWLQRCLRYSLAISPAELSSNGTRGTAAMRLVSYCH